MNTEANTDEKWLFEITPKNKFFSLNLKEVWQYRDLLLLFVKRDVVTVYKQTILGPLWYLIQPLFTSITFTIIFNTVAGISRGSRGCPESGATSRGASGMRAAPHRGAVA